MPSRWGFRHDSPVTARENGWRLPVAAHAARTCQASDKKQGADRHRLPKRTYRDDPESFKAHDRAAAKAKVSWTEWVRAILARALRDAEK